jgi:hypothetical protein
MTAFKGAYVTKYDAGGSGDNIIPDGYIKTVEKIWLDYFAFTAVLTTADTVTIASIPPGKKITAVEVYFPTIAPTTCTIQVGVQGSTSLFITSASTLKFTSTGGVLGTNVVTTNAPGGAGYYATTGTTNTLIQMQIGVTAMTSPTAGTIYTKVSYT